MNWAQPTISGAKMWVRDDAIEVVSIDLENNSVVIINAGLVTNVLLKVTKTATAACR